MSSEASGDKKLVNLTIDGRSVEIEKNSTVLQAAHKLGIEIPTLCHVDWMEPYGACRLCSVEVIKGKRRRLVTACNYPVSDRIVIETINDRIRRVRAMIIELLLGRSSNVPLLQELGKQYGVEKSRFGEGTEGCILCGLCTRVCDEIVGVGAIAMDGRGIKRRVATPYDEESKTCIACGACAAVCPTGYIKVIDDTRTEKGVPLEFPTGPTTSIYVKTLQSVPKVPVIDVESCIKMQTGGCGVCATYCEPGAINYNQKPEEIEVDVGQILISTGFQTIDLKKFAQYGYGRLDNVYSALEFERMLNATGPTGSQVVLKNGQEPRAVGIIHCIGSRDENHHRYCSRVCCMYALKMAHLIKDRTKAAVYQFYIDMRAFGKGYEEFYHRLLDEGVTMIRGKAAEVVEAGWGQRDEGVLLIRAEDTLIGKFREIPVDMVVLCAAMEPQHDADEVGRLFSISRSPDGFFLERHPKLDPTSTMTDGIYLAGACQSPKDIPDSVAQAQGAAARILQLISRGYVEVDPIRAEVVEELCGGCRMCNNLCPYGAIEFVLDKKISRVNDALCKGCGTCVAACPAGAITGKGFTNAQIMAEIDGLFAKPTQGAKA
jgi:heterodisulfide reductase subunit A